MRNVTVIAWCNLKMPMLLWKLFLFFPHQLDCKTVNIFAYSSTRQTTGLELGWKWRVKLGRAFKDCVLHACETLKFWEKTHLFCSLPINNVAGFNCTKTAIHLTYSGNVRYAWLFFLFSAMLFKIGVHGFHIPTAIINWMNTRGSLSDNKLKPVYTKALPLLDVNL